MRPERWPAAGTGGQTHQDLPRVPKSFFSGVMGSALEVLGIKRQYASNSFVPADETDRKNEGFAAVSRVRVRHISSRRWK